jgi:uncharacterized membrane protein YkvA (DUF1232 family)
MRFRAQVASWQDIAALTQRVAADEPSFRHKIWRRLLREAASLPFVEEVLTAHYCVFDRHTPIYVKAVLVGAIVYFIAPDDLIPIPSSLMGLADDAALLGVAFKAVASHIKPEHREAARRALEHMRAKTV